MKALFDLISRIFISTIFLYEAYDSIFYYHQTKKTMSSYGLDWQQDLLLTISIFLLVGGGLLLLIGYRTTIGSIMLILYYLPLTFIIHYFWKGDLQEQRIQGIMFMKNIAIIGGLIHIIIYGVGRYSIKTIFART